MDDDPLFTPGFHNLENAMLESNFVEPFPDSNIRSILLDRLRLFLEELKSFGVSVEVWIDGSFATRKTNPNDIDLALVLSKTEIEALPTSTQSLLFAFLNRTIIKLRYQCDIYPFVNEDADWRSYWRGWFGFDREERSKGIPRIFL